MTLSRERAPLPLFFPVEHWLGSGVMFILPYFPPAWWRTPDIFWQTQPRGFEYHLSNPCFLLCYVSFSSHNTLGWTNVLFFWGTVVLCVCVCPLMHTHLCVLVCTCVCFLCQYVCTCIYVHVSGGQTEVGTCVFLNWSPPYFLGYLTEPGDH